MTAVLALASVGTSGSARAARALSAGSLEMQHGAGPMGGMSMPGVPHESAGGVGCDDCAPPSDTSPPCDHQSMAGQCASMMSCVTTIAEVHSRTPATPDAGAGHANAILASAPASVALPTETPPPRV